MSNSKKTSKKSKKAAPTDEQLEQQRKSKILARGGANLASKQARKNAANSPK